MPSLQVGKLSAWQAILDAAGVALPLTPEDH